VKLTATVSNCEEIEDGIKVSLVTNGQTVQVYDATKFDLLVTLERIEMRFHMDDDKTDMTLTGYRCVNVKRGFWELVTIDLT